MTFLRASTLLLFLPLVACNKGPEQVSSAPPASTNSHMGMGQGQMPADATHNPVQSPHGTQGQVANATVIASGEAELAGDFAGVAEGWLFVMSKATDTGAPGFVAKVDVSSGTKNAAGNQVVPFTLSSGDFSMGGDVGESFNLEVRYDHDGMVDSKDGNGSVTIPATKGQAGISVKVEKID